MSVAVPRKDDVAKERPVADARARAKSIFRPLDTEHTFDQLEVPGGPKLARSHPLLSPKQQGAEESRERRARTHSFPGPAIVVSDADEEGIAEGYHEAALGDETAQHLGRRRGDKVLAPGDHFPQLAVSYSWKPPQPYQDGSRTVSTQSVVHHESAAVEPVKPQYSAWARFPSHTRKERTLSAGIADGVIVRDFAPSVHSKHSDDELSPTNSMTSSKKNRVKKRKKTKTATQARLKIWQKRMNEIFKPWMGGSRKGETGHRSSIAPGGSVAYPELEMIPGSAASDTEER